MKNKAGKMIMLTGMMCILGLGVCACDGVGKTPNTEERQDIWSEPIPKGDQDEDSVSEPAADQEGEGIENGLESPETSTGPKDNENNRKNTDSTQSATQNTSAKWVDSAPGLEGNIKELGDRQFTVIEAVIGKSDNGGDIMVLPGEGGDDSEFNKISVTYDDTSLFMIKTIYDGGARSEISAATAADLAPGQLVNVWGSSSNGVMKATQICIIKVV